MTMHRHIRSRGGGAGATDETSQHTDDLKACVADPPLSQRCDYLQDEEEKGEPRIFSKGDRRAEVDRHVLINPTGSTTIAKDPKACDRHPRAASASAPVTVGPRPPP